MARPCTEYFRITAYPQLTWRESLRDTGATQGANAANLFGMGVRQAVRRSTLADVNERRDWRIQSDLATLPIRRARKRYTKRTWGSTSISLATFTPWTAASAH